MFLAVLAVDYDLHLRRGEAVLHQVAGFFVDEPFGSDDRQGGDEGLHGAGVGGQRLWRDEPPAAGLPFEDGAGAVPALNFNPDELVFRNF